MRAKPMAPWLSDAAGVRARVFAIDFDVSKCLRRLAHTSFGHVLLRESCLPDEAFSLIR